MYSVIVRYKDGQLEPGGGPLDDLGQAAGLALTLADQLGLDLASDDPRPPIAVEIHSAYQMELSICVLPGGLINDALPSGQRSPPKSTTLLP